MDAEFGSKVQKLRRLAGLTLYEVAQKMSVSSAFLSAIENGKKRVPDDFVSRFIAAVPDAAPELVSLEVLANKARKQVALSLDEASINDAHLATALARKFSTLTAEQKEKINAIIGNYNSINGDHH